ncbi:multifunctional matrix-like protein [Mammarenavirus lujoense]|uniref:Multifunctional matrix-like protein n=1 Tax=Mammarenavirus lujoense TaxID=3052314 RepID=C5ILC3_9VIRU|nr:multifunctional matrix-like protein [Mammarenavirus lujoense]ACR56361.1 multifunctional matrix-like protein [Mammarenavirus lujoense]AFP21516.1 Z protein [Mammarenavirus lujoense]AFP21518.1 Z protein [Mammarenavirus lujoense]
MGQRHSSGSGQPNPKPSDSDHEARRSELHSDASHLGPLNCKSCWKSKKALVKCYDHYLCLNCLSLLMGITPRCPFCYRELPKNLDLAEAPSAPPL